MDIKHKLYPHPVLKNETDDYKTSQFSCSLQQEKGSDHFLFTATFQLDNPQLLQMVEEEQVEYVLHVECPLSSFRNVFSSKESVFSIKLEDVRLLDRVSICSFLLAKVDIENYSNEDFDEDYADTTFPCEKGAILAVGSQVTFSVEKDKNDLATAPSIFKIYHKLNHKDENAVVELDDNDIKIGLNQEDYLQYQSQCRNHTNVVNSFLIFPALIYALEYIKKDFEESEDLKWVQALRQALKKRGLTLNQDLLDRTPSFNLAQILMQAPVSSAFTELQQHYSRWEEDEP